MMSMQGIFKVCAAAGMLTLAVGALATAEAQRTTLDAGTIAYSKSPAVIRKQLTLASRLGHQTLAGLEAASSEEPMPMDESVVQPARDTYVLIRAALAGLQQANETQRFPDPLIDLAYKRVLDAWNLSRTPIDLNSKRGSRRAYLAQSIPNLRQALSLVDQALAILP